MKLTPMLQQYFRIKAEHREAILLFRLGDFYEMFFEDAEIASRILDITLTSRNRGEGADAIPLCGVPYHAVEPYIARLLAAGWKVAICEQREGAGRSLMERDVVRIITPGSVLNEASLEPSRPNHLAGVATDGRRWGLVVVEFSTGSVRVTEVGSWDALYAELDRLEVRELVLASDVAGEERARLEAGPWVLSTSGESAGQVDETQTWCRTLTNWPLAREAVQATLGYLASTHRGALHHLRAPEPYEVDHYLAIDGASRRNLELVATFGGERRGSLLWVLDHTTTPMGARTLRAWLLAPLLAAEAIGRRLDAVEELVDGVPLREAVAGALRGMGG